MDADATFLLGGAALGVVVLPVVVGRFSQLEVPWFAFLASLLGFALSFGIVWLVPFDVYEALASSAANKRQEALPPQMFVAFVWELIYWPLFVLCWFLCPVLIEFESAGDFTFLGRLRAALKQSAAWYVAYLVFGGVVMLYLAMDGSTTGSLGAWCIAAANAWGLLFSSVLVGYGLTALPRHLWRLASPTRQLRTLYCAAVSMDEARLSTQFELQDVICEARVEVSSRSQRRWDPKLERALAILQQTLEDCELLHCELATGPGGTMVRDGDPGHGCAVPRGGVEATRLECLAHLHRALKQACLEARRAACRWEDVVRKCGFLEDLEENMFPTPVELASAWQGSLARSLCRWPVARGCWHAFVVLWLRWLRPLVLRALSIVCSFMSATIVLGQLTLFSERRFLSLLALFLETSHSFVVTQVFCFVALGYILCTAYWSVFRLKSAGWYGLYPNHNTDTSSLLWCASMLARLSAPLCYQFLVLVRVHGTAFQAMMDQGNAVPVFGASFIKVFPLLVCFFCICNIVNVYSRLVQFCGLEALEFEWAPSDSSAADDLLAEGRRLLERERRRRSEERSLLELHERTTEGARVIPLKLQISTLIEDGTLPCDWNASSPG